MMILAERDGDWRTPLPEKLPLGHIERRWFRYVVADGAIDRTRWEMATYSVLASALAVGDIWVPTLRLHRSLDVLLAPEPGAAPLRIGRLPDPRAWLAARAAELDAALLEVSEGRSCQQRVRVAAAPNSRRSHALGSSGFELDLQGC